MLHGTASKSAPQSISLNKFLRITGSGSGPSPIMPLLRSGVSGSESIIIFGCIESSFAGASRVGDDHRRGRCRDADRGVCDPDRGDEDRGRADRGDAEPFLGERVAYGAGDIKCAGRGRLYYPGLRGGFKAS